MNGLIGQQCFCMRNFAQMVLWFHWHNNGRVGGWNSVLVVDQDGVCLEVLLYSIVLQEDCSADEVCVEIFYHYCLELHFPSIPEKCFCDFSYSRQFCNSICQCRQLRIWGNSKLKMLGCRHFNIIYRSIGVQFYVDDPLVRGKNS